MSKAFDSINRKTLIEDLQQILENDDLHLVYKLIQIELAAKVGNHTSDFFTTDTGAPQGDCLSANQFTFYLAKTLSSNKQHEHDYCKHPNNNPLPKHLLEHNYNETKNKHLMISMESGFSV